MPVKHEVFMSKEAIYDEFHSGGSSIVNMKFNEVLLRGEN